MFILGGKQSGGSRRASRTQHIQHEMATAVREACDAATADVAREKWLELEVERQRQVADASVEQLSCMERDKKELAKRVKQLEGALAQHETYAQLEAQGAQHVELEMRKMRLQLKEKNLEIQSLKQQLEGANQKMQADAKAGAAIGAATHTAWEAHRQLLRKLFALVVRGSVAVQALNAAMQQSPRATSYPAGMSQCVEVLESLIALRQTCAQLLSAGGINSNSLGEAGQESSNGTAGPGGFCPAAADGEPSPWSGAYSSNNGAAPDGACHSPAYQPQSMPGGRAGGYSPRPPAGLTRSMSLQHARSEGFAGGFAGQRLPPTAEGYPSCFDPYALRTDNGTYSVGPAPGEQGMLGSGQLSARSNSHSGMPAAHTGLCREGSFGSSYQPSPRASSASAVQRLRHLQELKAAAGQLRCHASPVQGSTYAGSHCGTGGEGPTPGYGSEAHSVLNSPYGIRSARGSEYYTPHSASAAGTDWWSTQ